MSILYDVENGWIGENIFTNSGEHETRFAYDGNQIVLEFDKDVAGAGLSTGSPLPPGEGQGEGVPFGVNDLSHRYTWQPGAVDQLMADEHVHLDANGKIATAELLFALTDQQGTVHDLAKFNSSTGVTAVVDHIIRDSFGKVISEDLKRGHHSFTSFSGSEISDVPFSAPTGSPLPPGEGQGEGVPLTVSDLTHRYTWQPGAVDQLMADEHTRLGANGKIATAELLFALTDQQGTVHDMAKLNTSTGATAVVDHIIRDSFGKVISESNPAQGCLIGWTGRPSDPATGLQNNLNRWYDAKVGRWLSEDPSGFTAGQTNLYVYCGNSPTNAVDPSGLIGEDWIIDTVNGVVESVKVPGVGTFTGPTAVEDALHAVAPDLTPAEYAEFEPILERAEAYGAGKGDITD